MDIYIYDSQVALTGNGTTSGVVTVADNTPFYPGTAVWIYGTTAAKLNCVVTDLVGTTGVKLRAIGQPLTLAGAPKYGNSDMSAYTTADGATISIPAQLAPVISINPVTKLPHA